MRWGSLAACGLLALAWGLSGHSTQPAQADEATFASDLERCNKLVERQRWAAAREAFAELFDSHEGEPIVWRHLPEIEDALKLCVFNEKKKPLHPRHVFGPGCKKFTERTREVVVEGPATQAFHWVGGDENRQYDVLFDGDVELEFTPAEHCETTALLCFDPEKDGGYLVTAGFQQTGALNVLSIPRAIYRMDAEGKRELFRKDHGADTKRRPKVRYARKGSSITAKLGSKTVARASDGKYRRGYVALLGVVPSRVRVEGRVNEEWWERAVGRLEAEKFRVWCEKWWTRTRHLPKWVLAAPPIGGASVSSEVLLPAEIDADVGERVRELLQRVYANDASAFDEADELLAVLDGPIADYLAALDDLSFGEYQMARMWLESVLEESPDFAPAMVFLARVHARTGRREEARALLAAAAPKCGDFAPYHEECAWLAFAEGDFDAVAEALSAAAENGASSTLLDVIGKLNYRAQRGPQWPQRHEHRTRHFEIASDLSRDICQEVGTVLETALTAYSGRFKSLTRRKRARVYVFSGREGYLAYARELGFDITGSAGVYNPVMRELVLWTHDDQEELWDTVRHEAFHQYLHNFIEDAPLWFNEGYAEYFGFASYGKGRLELGTVDRRQRKQLAKQRQHFVPVRSLIRMDRERFMEQADVFYVQAWALVHLLRHTKQSGLSGVLDDYFDALLDGASADSAYDETISLVIDELQPAFDSHVAKLLEK